MNSVDYYENEEMLSEYLLFHYGDNTEYFPFNWDINFSLNFHKKVVEIVQENTNSQQTKNALEIGCAVGRACFELSKTFDNVCGIDFSSSFIKSANRIKNSKELEFEYKESGHTKKHSFFCLDKETHPERITFEVGDAMNLQSSLGEFDAVIMINLIDRLPDPKKLLSEVHRFVKPDGVLLIVSPYTWLSDFTKKENWLTAKPGESIETKENIKTHLDKNFEFLKQEDVPFLIREHQRKYQLSVSEATLWKRRS